jgi:uncharacterized protein (DUF433 family)
LEGVFVRERISIRPDVHFGKPCVAGTRITVQSVLELVRDGVTPADILRDYYPDLTADDLRACVQYAIDLITLEDVHLAASA